MRVDDWEKRLKEIIAKHESIGPDYAYSNCYIFPDDVVLALTGKRMHPEMYRGGKAPKTEIGAAKRLRKHGFRNVREAFDAALPKVPLSMAGRGDLVIIERGGQYSGGVMTVVGIAAITDEGLRYFPRSEAIFAYRVE